MPQRLAPRRTGAYTSEDRDCVYAYEHPLQVFSLDPNSPYRGPEGAARLWREIRGDYTKDGKITLGQHGMPNGSNVSYRYIPPVSGRVEVRADSTIIYKTVNLPGGAGSIETRYATANR